MISSVELDGPSVASILVARFLFMGMATTVNVDSLKTTAAYDCGVTRYESEIPFGRL